MPRTSGKKDVAQEPKAVTSQVTSNIELELLCIGDDEDQKLHEMYGPQCWPGGEADPRVFSEIDVVQHHEGVELQSCFYLVELWRSTGEGLYTQTLEKHGRTPQLDCIG